LDSALQVKEKVVKYRNGFFGEELQEHADMKSKN
jgi:hypothetical protein